MRRSLAKPLDRSTLLRIASFYRFVRVDDPAALQADLQTATGGQTLSGTIIVASEGINGTVAGPPDAVTALLDHLQSDARFADLSVKLAVTHNPPFGGVKVKLKREIVTFRAPVGDPCERTGTRVAPQDWDAWIAEPDVVLIDTRNRYEVAIGSFRGAMDPKTPNFTAFKAFVDENLDPARHKRIAMFCTGGIRCEKASAYLLARGFPEVAQLDGGILRYLEEMPAGGAWQGECYVFDGRIAVGPGLVPGTHANCEACGMPVSAKTPCACPSA